MGKADYVRAQSQNRDHHCHWPDCNRQVPPAMWGCKEHWFKLPKPLRDLIWRAYRPGQEKDQRPSREYVDAARQVQAWIAEHFPAKPQQAAPAKPMFVWLSDEYSVPAETICLHEPPEPNRDHRCVRVKGHPGRHEYRMATEAPGLIRDYSHKDSGR